MNVELTNDELVIITRAIRATAPDMPNIKEAVGNAKATLYWKLLDLSFREDMANEMSKYGCD